jgi:hypothetical protein
VPQRASPDLTEILCNRGQPAPDGVLPKSKVGCGSSIRRATIWSKPEARALGLPLSNGQPSPEGLYESEAGGYPSREGCGVQLRVDLGLGQDPDAAELYDATRGLRDELLQLDVDDVQPLHEGAPPQGARAIDVALLGSLAVSAGQEVIGAVVRAVAHWIGRRVDRTVKLTIGEDSIELSDASSDDQHKLIEAFLARHGAEA